MQQHVTRVLPKMYDVVAQLCRPDPPRPPMSPHHKCDAEGLLGLPTGGLVASLKKSVMPAFEKVLAAQGPATPEPAPEDQG